MKTGLYIEDLLPLSPLDEKIVQRGSSFFASDLIAYQNRLEDTIKGKRVLLIGGAGSIGFQTLKVIARFSPKTVHVIDHNENGLAEVVRSLRSSKVPLAVDEFVTLPFDYGSDVFRLWLQNQGEYDLILNFSALKHVRSEKDPYSILAMIDTNVCKLQRLARHLSLSKRTKRFFSVSTDKAANPSSMMGATKRMMEHALFSSSLAWPEQIEISSARFANVAMSNGSLLQSWQLRIAQGQPIACPKGCRRFFVSLNESGHLCTLAGLLGEKNSILIPDLEPEKHLNLLEDVVGHFLDDQGLTPFFTEDENEALAKVEECAAKNQWPVLLTPLNTAGEKPYEEFVAKNEKVSDTKFDSLCCVEYLPPDAPDAFVKFLDTVEAHLQSSDSEPLSADCVKAWIASVEPAFAQSHVVSNQALDQRI